MKPDSYFALSIGLAIFTHEMSTNKFSVFSVKPDFVGTHRDYS